jgi:Trypsin-co-occurring domain 1
MQDLVEFKLADGTSILVESDDARKQPLTRGRGQRTEIVTKASKTFEEAIAQVRPFASEMIARLREGAERPDEIDIEFGMKLNAEAGAIIARTGGEANFKITLRWRRG